MQTQFNLPRSIIRFGLLAIALALSGGGAQGEDAPKKNPALNEIPDSFKSGGETIQVKRFEPAGPDKRPAVILLHGCDGWEQLDGYRFAAQGLTESGHIAIVIRYFDRTRTPDQVAPAQREEFVRWLRGDAIKEKKNVARQHFEEWIETVKDAVAYTRSLPNVDAARVGIAGFSLGGYLALSAAPVCEPPVGAVVEMFGGLPEERRKGLGKLPPTLILHGEEDEVVSVSEAYKAAGVLVAQKQHVELVIQKDLGHGCYRAGKPDLLEMFKARNRMISFLKQQLAPTGTDTSRK